MASLEARSRRTNGRLWLGGILVAHAGLLAWSAWCHSPAINETVHLAAGVSHVEFGRFDLLRVNPPLIRTLAALPVWLASPATDWSHYDAHPLRRSEYRVGLDFSEANGSRVVRLVTIARWACIPFSLLGGYVCFRWAGQLYGAMAGYLALALWCFDPYVLGYASLMMPDAHAAALGLAASYSFWRWLKDPTWPRISTAAALLGLAELAKFTALVFFAVWPALWLVYRVPNRCDPRRWKPVREAAMLSAGLGISVLIINLGYGYEGSFQPLAAYRFQSRVLSGIQGSHGDLATGANRVGGTRLGLLPVPVPKNYLQGIDTQKSQCERDLWSYFRGRWQEGGRWYYDLYALAVKLPLGTWLLVVLATVAGVLGPGCVASWRNEIVLLLPVLVTLALVSSQTGLNMHSYYVLPVLPFAFVWMSKVVRFLRRQHPALGRMAAIGLCWALGSSLWVYPHSLSYFNELAGGPRHGHFHLLDSNVSAGQDFLYLKQWLAQHPEADPLSMAVVGDIPAFVAAIADTRPLLLRGVLPRRHRRLLDLHLSHHVGECTSSAAGIGNIAAIVGIARMIGQNRGQALSISADRWRGGPGRSSA